MKPWQFQPAHDQGLSLAESFRSQRRENGLVATALHFLWWGVVRVYLAFWHRLRIRGREHLPARPPFLLVANHASHLDTLVLASALPWRLRDRLYPIAAGDVFFETPTRRAFAALLLNALPIWRKKSSGHALQDLRRRLLEEGCCYILFPEGTRSRDGTMGSFKVGLGMLVAGTDVPVVPCFLEGCHQAWKPSWRWPRPRSIRLHIGLPLAFPDVPPDRSGWERIGARLEEAVRALNPANTPPTAS